MGGVLSKFSSADFHINNKGEIVSSGDVVFTIEQKEFLESKGIPLDYKDSNFFMHPYIIPPLEFYNDVQDAIRMFTGGKRFTQRGYHYDISSTKEIISILSKYTTDKNIDKPYHVLAGEFIQEFFTKEIDFTIKPDMGEVIESYSLDFS